MPHHPDEQPHKRSRQGQQDEHIPGWAVDRILDLKRKLEHTYHPDLKKEIEAQIQRLSRLRHGDPPPP